jgi:hypothetical protein
VASEKGDTGHTALFAAGDDGGTHDDAMNAVDEGLGKNSQKFFLHGRFIVTILGR